MLDFAVICDPPNTEKYEYLTFPDCDRWGVVMLNTNPLAKKKSIKVTDLYDQPLYCSEQSWNYEIKYNASMFAKEGLGLLLTFEHLIDCSKESDLIFRPLSPKQITKLYLIWNKYQTFTPIAEKFLNQIKASF